MQRNLNTAINRPRRVWLSLMVLSALVVSGCGPLDDEDEDPTATTETIEQPTIAGDGEGEASPAGLPGETTPVMSVATPGLPAPGEDRGTPSAFVPGSSGTPASLEDVDGPPSPGALPGSGQDPESSDSTDAAFTGSDGTSGATPGSDVLEPSDDADSSPDPNEPFFVEETPTPTFATPAPGATPQDGEIAALPPVVASSCEPAAVPPLDAEVVEYETVIDVNFRTGPGEDCETIGDGPIATNIAVTVLSGPVVREDDDAFLWVQVQIADEVGWIVIDAIEPAP